MHSITKSNEEIYRKVFQNTCQNIKVKTYIDIGSFDGLESIKLGKLVNAKKIICVDHDSKALNRARKRGCQTILADLNTKIPLPSNTADLITCNQVIEHVARTDNLVKEVKRILKPGGISLWCTPNLSSWHNIFALIFGYQPFSSQISDEIFIGNPWHPEYKNKINEKQAHLRIFTKYSLREILSFHGFQILEEEGIGYYFPISFVSKYFCKIDPRHAAYLFTSAIKPK